MRANFLGGRLAVSSDRFRLNRVRTVQLAIEVELNCNEMHISDEAVDLSVEEMEGVVASRHFLSSPQTNRTKNSYQKATLHPKGDTDET